MDLKTLINGYKLRSEYYTGIFTGYEFLLFFLGTIWFILVLLYILYLRNTNQNLEDVLEETRDALEDTRKLLYQLDQELAVSKRRLQILKKTLVTEKENHLEQNTEIRNVISKCIICRENLMCNTDLVLPRRNPIRACRFKASGMRENE
jgi:hypothetical protein